MSGSHSFDIYLHWATIAVSLTYDRWGIDRLGRVPRDRFRWEAGLKDMDSRPFMAAQHLVLHVDDNRDDAFLLRRVLKASATDWEVHYVHSGERALTYLGAAKTGRTVMPSLILLDIKMPRVDGFAVLAWIQDNHRDVPVAMLSSSDEPKDQARAAAGGAFRHFVKSPFFSDVVECLNDLHNGPSVHAAA
jgi:two-component system, response regulator